MFTRRPSPSTTTPAPAGCSPLSDSERSGWEWGDKAADLATLVTGFELGYSTGELDPPLGGPGASIGIAFYSGTTGSGVPGAEVARFGVPGLPGAATTGECTAYVISVDLPGGFELYLPDSDIGYSYCSST